MRIAIIGYSGAGKSTLARSLGRRYCCPVLHMDALHFRRDWQEREDGKARFILSAYLRNPDWVIEGNYRSLALDRRLEEADHILILRLPRLCCLRQAYGRYRQNRGRVREGMAPGCVEKFDFSFLWWLLWRGRAGAPPPRDQKKRAQKGGKVTHGPTRPAGTPRQEARRPRPP
ncbi:MAG: hypothetical protein PUK81_09900, partial [Firmicutes bacterium]|nr:hypothetical protein [Bacillota bacterium]